LIPPSTLAVSGAAAVALTVTPGVSSTVWLGMAPLKKAGLVLVVLIRKVEFLTITLDTPRYVVAELTRSAGSVAEMPTLGLMVEPRAADEGTVELKTTGSDGCWGTPNCAKLLSNPAVV